MKHLLKYLSPLKKRLVLGFFIKFLGTVSELFIPFLLTYILENVIVTGSVKEIVFYGAVMVFCAVVAALGNIIANRMAAKTTMKFSAAMRHELFSKTLLLSARDTDTFTIPSLEARITSDTYNVQNFVGMAQRMGIRAPILLLGGVIVTLIMDRALALVMISTLPFIFIIVYGISKKGVPLYTGVQKSVDDMVRVVREDAQGIRVIKALSKNDFENRRYDAVNRALCKKETHAQSVMGVVNPVMTMLMNLGIAAVVAVSAYLVHKGISSPAVVIAFMQYFTLISMAMMSLSRMFVMYTKCAASAERISEVITLERELSVISAPVDDSRDAHIVFDNVSFSYLGKKNDCENVSFSLERGESLGIIGATGSGKTTIIKLLLRFYDADLGKILISGRDVRSFNKEELSSMFGLVLQNDFLYADTIEENIRFGRELDCDSIKEAAKIAQAYDFITAFPDGFSHRLSSKGTNISGGQRQRILIARAIAEKPEILILDDSSSALDYKTDASLRAALRENLKNTTIVTVAQRVSSVKNCSLILVADDGKIIGSGTHEELILSCPEYREISDSQMGGAILD